MLGHDVPRATPRSQGAPDRLLPVDAATRAVARELYEMVADAPIISPHGHVSAMQLAADVPFEDPASLLITQDHYLTRLLHADGVPLERLGVGGGADPRQVWRIVAEHWHVFAGTATGLWLADALAGVFGIDDELTPASADALYDRIAARLATEEFRPRALFRRFGIDVLATTDDPLDDLEPHRRLQADGFRVLPTFRPDRYVDPGQPGFTEALPRLLAITSAPATFEGYLAALQARREHFVAAGAVSADHGVVDTATVDLELAEASTLFDRILRGSADRGELARFRAHMLLQLARMSVEDGLVMTLHPGVYRNHSSATLHRHGPDTGHDIPVQTTFVEGLRPLLERFGLEPGFHLILFTVDETAFSREIAPLAGFYPSVYIGSPWWFLDAPDAILRYRAAVTETAGFYRGSGFVDDTRAFLSIPARHDTARRVDSAFLARLVVEGRLGHESAQRICADLVDAIPRRAFKL
ncbi:MAG: glucuronate isomerase [Microbacterium sp.]|uniref:glucuronate isomerase n=1 Tax=Microbacterium sp. TaxID=51671 RepID=UPI0039E4057B